MSPQKTIRKNDLKDRSYLSLGFPSLLLFSRKKNLVPLSTQPFLHSYIYTQYTFSGNPSMDNYKKYCKTTSGGYNLPAWLPVVYRVS